MRIFRNRKSSETISLWFLSQLQIILFHMSCLKMQDYALGLEYLSILLSVLYSKYLTISFNEIQKRILVFQERFLSLLSISGFLDNSCTCVLYLNKNLELEYLDQGKNLKLRFFTFTVGFLRFLAPAESSNPVGHSFILE